MIPNGLKPKTEDKRDIKFGSILSLPKLSDVPDEYGIGLPVVVNQGFDTDFCTGAGGHAVLSIQEGSPLAYKWAFAVGKMLEGGDVESFGLELRTMAKVLVKYGVPNEDEMPVDFKDKPLDFLRRIENWPEYLFEAASKHKQGSFFDVTGPYDHFDNIRAVIWKLKVSGIMLGVQWGWSLNQTIMETLGNGGGGHCLGSIGWAMKNGAIYMHIQNSFGPEVGEEGRHWFSREVINNFVEKYGAIGFLDMPVEDVRYHVDNGIKIDDNWLKQFFGMIINLCKK